MVAWWAISGNLPTTYLPCSEIPDARAFLRAVSQRWLAVPEVIEQSGRPHFFRSLRQCAEILEEWAADDESWEEEE